MNPAVEQAVAEQFVKNYWEATDFFRSVPWIAEEILPAAERAIQAGAVPPLEYKGAGATGIVFCDDREEPHAYKVARERAEQTIADEAEWLATAREVPGVREHVAELYAYHPEEHVIERECVRGERVPWRDESDLRRLHDRIESQMRKHDWGPPEFKRDSYVVDETGPKLVDAGFVNRFGDRLTEHIEAVLDGRKPRGNDKPRDFAWSLRWDNPEPRSERVERLLERLYAMGAPRE